LPTTKFKPVASLFSGDDEESAFSTRNIKIPPSQTQGGTEPTKQPYFKAA